MYIIICFLTEKVLEILKNWSHGNFLAIRYITIMDTTKHTGVEAIKMVTDSSTKLASYLVQTLESILGFRYILIGQCRIHDFTFYYNINIVLGNFLLL